MPTDFFEDSVAFFWELENSSGREITTEILPDGFFDILFTSNDRINYRMIIAGLQTRPVSYLVPKNCHTLSISFKLPGMLFFPDLPVAELINSTKDLKDSWDMKPKDFLNLENFCQKTTAILKNKMPPELHSGLLRLCQEIYSSNGEKRVQEYADAAHLTGRTLRRNFLQNFGINLKLYCKILRFRETFEGLHRGERFPTNYYFDQSHFIHQSKELSGATPKELCENKNDRFLQLSTL